MKFKKAPRTKWRFIRGPVKMDGFEATVDSYISMLEKTGITDQNEILRRFFIDGLALEGELTAKDILMAFAKRVNRLEEVIDELEGEVNQYRQSILDILEDEYDNALKEKNKTLMMCFDSAIEHFMHGGGPDAAVFSLCSDIKYFERRKKTDKTK